MSRPLLILATFALFVWAGELGTGAVPALSTTPAVAQETSDDPPDQPPSPWPQTIGMNLFGPDDVDLDTVTAHPFDQGRLHTFDDPPIEHFQDTYNFPVDDTWFERARQGMIRLPECSGSFVSEQGLVLTNQQCVQDYAAQVSDANEDLAEDGFYASSIEEERPIDDAYAEQLVDVTDVTDEVEAALAPAETPAERAAARREAIEQTEERLAEEHDAATHVEVAPQYEGARYAAYTFRQLEDVRLVFLPERAARSLGGTTDQFTYPRHTLDMALLRIYEGGEPMEPENAFAWAQGGSMPGDPVFALGHPAPTHRHETTAQLELRRDVVDRALMNWYDARAEALAEFAADRAVDAAFRDLHRTTRSNRKAYQGRIEALNEGYVLARHRSAERALADSLAANSSFDDAYGGLIDSLAAIQDEKRQFADAHQAFVGMEDPSLSAPVLRRALVADEWTRQRDAGASAESLTDLREELRSIPDIPDALERRFLVDRLERLVTHFGREHEIVTEALGDQSPDSLAARVLSESALADQESTEAALTDDALTREDPALNLVEAFSETYRDYRSAWSGLGGREAELARELGQARLAVFGTERPPDASSTPRIADGVIMNYEYNGTRAPPYTTFYGLYSRHQAFSGEEWQLPDRWMDPPRPLDRSTPVNLVSTNDVAGGSPGAPLVNRNLEVVGVVADRNVQGLAADYLYMPDQGMRAVSVDVRGMLEALGAVYEADRLYLELTGGPFVESEEAAEAVPERFEPN